MSQHHKDPNPKDAIGTRKLPFSVLSMRVMGEVALGMLEGALKYGRHNYRAAPVRASIYYDGTMRHLVRWWETGEDFDPDVPAGVQIHHLSKAIASLVVIRDAIAFGTWIDDRPPSHQPFMLDFNEEAAKLIDSVANPVASYVREPPGEGGDPLAAAKREQAAAALMNFERLSRMLGSAFPPLPHTVRDQYHAARDVLLNMVNGTFPGPLEAGTEMEEGDQAQPFWPDGVDESHGGSELPLAPVHYKREGE